MQRSHTYINEDRRKHRHRHGGFAVVVLVCLLIAGMVLASLVKLSMLQDRQFGRDQWRVQAGWLADSGIARAAARLAGNADYAGETWEINAERLGGDAAIVVIRVENHEEGGGRRRLVTAEAVYPAAGPEQARQTHQLIVSLSEES